MHAAPLATTCAAAMRTREALAPIAGCQNSDGTRQSDRVEIHQNIRSRYGSSDISLVHSASGQAREVQVRMFP